MTLSLPKSYRYGMSAWLLLIALFFFGVLLATSLNLAWTNDEGFLLLGIFQLSIQQATLFWWLGSVGMLSLLVLTFWMFFQHVVKPMPLVLSETNVHIPVGFIRRRMQIMEFQDLQQCHAHHVDHVGVLMLTTSTQRARILSSQLSSLDDYEELKTYVMKKARANRKANVQESAPY